MIGAVGASDVTMAWDKVSQPRSATPNAQESTKSAEADVSLNVSMSVLKKSQEMSKDMVDKLLG